MIKCAYYLKLFLITAIMIVLLASVENAPEHPTVFSSVLIFFIFSIRLLWQSVRKSEVTMRTNKVNIERRATPKDSIANEKEKAA